MQPRLWQRLQNAFRGAEQRMEALTRRLPPSLVFLPLPLVKSFEAGAGPNVKNASGNFGLQTFVPCRHCNGFPASGQLGGHTNPTTPFPRICTFSDPQHLRTYQVQTSKMKMKIEDDAVDAKGGTTLGRHGRHGCRGRHRAYRPPTAFGRLQPLRGGGRHDRRTRRLLGYARLTHRSYHRARVVVTA